MISRIALSSRIVLAYGLVLCLVCLLDAGRFFRMLEREAGDIPEMAEAAGFIRENASGFMKVSEIETRLLAQLTPQKTIGAIAAPAQADEAENLPEIQTSLSESSGAALPLTGGNQTSSTGLANFSAPSGIAPALTESTKPTEPAEPAEPVEPRPTATTRPKVLIVGDSLIMEGFGPVLQRALRQRGDMDVVREGRYSTGLSRTDYFDWPATLAGLVDRDRPDLIIICMGANDGQDIIDENGKRHHADSASWGEIYRARADKLVSIATAKGSKVLWIGLPVMGKQPYSSRIRRLSTLQEAACDTTPLATFVNTEAVLADAKGEYITFLTDARGRHVRLRYKDMVHVTEDGGRLLTESLVPSVETALGISKASVSPSSTPGSPESKERGTVSDSISKGALVADASSGTVSDQVTAVPGQRVLHFFSGARHEEISYDAYLPVDARPDERFPALYLLHGAYEDKSAWSREMGDLLPQLATSLRMVLIAPSCGRTGWYVDSPLVPSNQMESFFIKELLPHAEANLPLTQKRSVVGISMGGHGALVLALRHPGMFASASSMSGVLDITRHPNQWGIKNLLGPRGTHRALWESYSALRLFERLPVNSFPPLLVTAGRDDSLILQENRASRDVLRHRGISYQYREAPGSHDWTYWRSEIPQHALFHDEMLRR